MLINRSFQGRSAQGESWEERWEGPDKGLVCSWLRGIEKARETPLLAEQAKRGELPALVWAGGGKAIKAGRRVGSLHYLAMWQGLRGEDLDIDTEAGATLTCSETNMVVTFTGDIRAIWKASSQGDEE